MIYYKNLQTNEIIGFQNENSIGQAFYDTTVYKKLTQSQSNAYELQKAKDDKKILVDSLRDEFINTKIIQVPIENDILNIGIDNNTSNEIAKIALTCMLNPSMTAVNFGDAITKTTKILSQASIMNYAAQAHALLNSDATGAFPKARIYKQQINECGTIQEINDIVITFEEVNNIDI